MNARALLLFATLSSCDRPTQTQAPTSTSTPTSTPSPTPTPSPSPSPKPSPFTALPLSGFADALLSVPAGDPRKPVLVATHGHGEPPDGICGVFRELVANRGYVLCLAGTRWPISGMYTYLSERSLGEELDTAMTMLHARFPEAQTDAAVYVGFSMGATFGVAPLVERATRFPRAIMIEGGVTDWSLGRIEKYAAGGGLRVLLACGLRRRVSVAKSVAASMRDHQLAADVVLGEDASGQEAGHTYYGDVAHAVSDRFAWLVEGDARWATTPR